MLQVEVDQRYTAVQVLDHPWVNVSSPFWSQSIHWNYLCTYKHWRNMQQWKSRWSCWRFVICVFQDDGVSENEHQLPVAGKIKKHFNTRPKLNSTTAGVSVITVSTHLQPSSHWHCMQLCISRLHSFMPLCFSCDALDVIQNWKDLQFWSSSYAPSA